MKTHESCDIEWNKLIPCVCRDCAGHPRADDGLHHLQPLFYLGGRRGHEVHHLHGRTTGAERQSGSSWRGPLHYRWWESIHFRHTHAMKRHTLRQHYLSGGEMFCTKRLPHTVVCCTLTTLMQNIWRYLDPFEFMKHNTVLHVWTWNDIKCFSAHGFQVCLHWWECPGMDTE